MSPIEFEERMCHINEKHVDDKNYIEDIHAEADNLLCELLVSLGYVDGIKIYGQLQKKFPYNYVRFTE